MKLILWTIVQALFGVSGTALLTHTLHGKGISVASLTEHAMTWQGIAGVLLMFASFLTMGYILSFAKLSAYIPVSTALTFLFTVLVTVTVMHESVTLPIVVGMILITIGIIVVSMGRS